MNFVHVCILQGILLGLYEGQVDIVLIINADFNWISWIKHMICICM